MVNWIVVAALALFVFLFFKFKEARHKITLVFLLLLLIFSAYSITRISSNHDIDLTSFEGFLAAGKVYFGWLVGAFGNVKTLTGYAVQQDWGLNSTQGS